MFLELKIVHFPLVERKLLNWIDWIYLFIFEFIKIIELSRKFWAKTLGFHFKSDIYTYYFVIKQWILPCNLIPNYYSIKILRDVFTREKDSKFPEMLSCLHLEVKAAAVDPAISGQLGHIEVRPNCSSVQLHFLNKLHL